MSLIKVISVADSKFLIGLKNFIILKMYIISYNPAGCPKCDVSSGCGQAIASTNSGTGRNYGCQKFRWTTPSRPTTQKGQILSANGHWESALTKGQHTDKPSTITILTFYILK
jgi:hypothetical protein